MAGITIAPAVKKVKMSLIKGEPEQAETEKLNSLQDQVFSEDKIHRKILSYIDVKDFKNCRLVSRRWKSVSTEIFQTLVAIRCSYENATAGFFIRVLHTSPFSITDESLTSLIDCMKLSAEIDPSSAGFPCQSFEFSRGHLNDPHLQNFLADFGPLIKDLSLDVIVTYADLSKLLVEQAPEIEKLYFGQHPGMFQLGPRMQEEPRALFPGSKVRLSNLKIVQFLRKAPISLVKDLLLAAENLKSVLFTEMNGELLDFLQNSGKLHLVSYLNFEPTEGNMSTFERISNVKDLKLKQLYMDLGTVYGVYDDDEPEPELWQEAAQQLSKIMRNSAGTLEIISWQNVRFLNGIKIPKFPKVKTIRFNLLGMHSEHEHKYFFPRGMSMSRTFPCLDRVILGFHPYNGYNDDFEDYFHSLVPVKTVKNLCLEDCNFCCEPAGWIAKYSRMFPNVTTATFKGIIGFSGISNEVWKFSKTEELVLHIEFGGDDEFLGNDSAFTGFSEERVATLLKEKPKSVPATMLKKWRVKKSILDLKHLSKLRLLFYNYTNEDDHDEEELNEMSPQTITEVTGRFGFFMCPQLKVELHTVANDLRLLPKMIEGVNGIRPYVASGPW